MSDSYRTISQSLDYLLVHYENRPGLKALAKRAGYTPAYFQKLFTAHVGISPQNLCRYLHYTHARDLLFYNSYPTLEAALESGLSGQGRLHDLMVTYEAATPGQIRSLGKGMDIHYGRGSSAFGDVFLACTKNGLCWLGFESGERESSDSQIKIREKWPKARLTECQEKIRPYLEFLHNLALPAKQRQRGKGKPKCHVHLFGTNFQIQVWQALLRIPEGGVISYGTLARTLGNHKAARAVGSAVGRNPVSLIIPCHRVIQSSGIVENYAWGNARKKYLLIKEVQNQHEGNEDARASG